MLSLTKTSCLFVVFTYDRNWFGLYTILVNPKGSGY